MKQGGFTLLEILLALAISSLLLGGLLAGIQQVVYGTSRIKNQVVTLSDVNFAQLQIKKDLEMAQSVIVGSSNISLSWIDYTTFSLSGNETRSHTSNYNLVGKELRRTYDGSTTIVGRRVSSVSFTQSDRVVSVVLTAAESGGITPRSKTLRFSVYSRGGGLPQQ